MRFLLLIALMVPSLAFAETGAIVGNIITSFQEAIKGFEAGILSAAKIIFFALLAVEIPVAAVKKTLGGDGWDDWMFFLPKILLAPLFFLCMIMLSDKYLKGIVQTFQYIGESAPDINFSASNLLGYGVSLAKLIVSNAGITALLDKPLIVLTVFVAAFLILIAFAVCAAQITMAYIESTIVVTLAPLYFSFGALSFVREWATKVFSHAVATGTKILIIFMLGYAMTKMGTNWVNIMKTADLMQQSDTAFEIMGSAAMMLFLSFQVPSIAAAIMSGNTTMGAGSAISSTLGAIAGAAAATAAGMGMIGKAMESMGSQANSSIGEALGGGLGNTMSALGGGGGEGGAGASMPFGGSVGEGGPGGQPPQSPFGQYPASEAPETGSAGASDDKTSGGSGNASGASLSGPDDQSGSGSGGNERGRGQRVMDSIGNVASFGQDQVIDDNAHAGASIDLSGPKT